MIRGLYTAASGMVTGLRMQEAVAENLANLSTPGFKAERLAANEFAGVLARRVGNAPVPVPLAVQSMLGRVGTGAYVAERETFLDAGAERATGRPLDLAIRGDGFFVVQDGEGVRYTRDGHFGRDAEGRLVASDGSPLLDVAGAPIAIASDRIRVDAFGRVFDIVLAEVAQPDGSVLIEQQEQEAGTIQVVTVPPEALVRSGESGFTLVPGAAPVPADLGETAVVVQGALEEANVEVTQVATELATLARLFETSQRVFSTIDETLESAVTDVGRVG
jgi:flagellar basal-body rod protein FlgF